MAVSQNYNIYNIMQQKSQQTKSKVTLKPKNPFILKFSTEQKPKRIHSLNRLNYPQNLQRDGTIIAKKDIIEHQLFDHHIVQTNMKIQGELKRLQVAFIHEKVPQFYAYYFMNRLITASEEKIEDKILKQLEEVKAKRSFFHVITNSIKARQGCLKQLQRCLENLFNNQEDNITKHVFREQITHYRKLTGFVIAHIRSWKQSLNDISPQVDFTTYLYHGEDYLLKLLNDCEFIFNSFLTRHLKFSYKNDPYIMRPYLQQKQSKFMDLFKFDDEQKNLYMIDMNFLASQRAKYLQTKMNSKNQKIKQIQRIYHYRDIPLTSRIFVRKMPTPKKEGQQQNKQIFIDNFMQRKGAESQKKLKLSELQKKSQKIKKIRQIFGKTSESTTRLINTDMFQTIGGTTNKNNFVSPYQQKLRYTQFHTKKIKIQNMNFQSDFQNLVRKKQLQVLQSDNFQASKTTRSFKNIKIKDNLSDSRKFITKEEGFNELQKILNQLDTFSPQKLQNFRLRKKQDPKSQTLMKLNQGKTAKSRLFEAPKTLLQHNQQVYVNVRNQVISQIQKDIEQKAKFEQKRIKQNQKIQQILQKKINQQSLRIISDSRVKQLEGRQNLAKQFQSSQLFGYDQPKAKNSQKLTYLEQQLKKQMQLKWLRQVQEELKRKTDIDQMSKIKRKQQAQLNKQLQKVKQKQRMQKKFQQIQRQQRAKILKQRLQLDEERKKQIQQQMRTVIQRQKQSMEKFAASQKIQIQGQLRQAMKVQMLQALKKQNQKFYDDSKKQQQMKQKQRQYRDQVRKKVEQQYSLGQQMKQNRQRQTKLAKIRLVKQKLGEFDTFAVKNASKRQKQKQIQLKKIEDEKSSPNKNILFNQQQAKSRITQFPDLRESVFPKYQKNAESEKKKLREQFQLQLFAFRKPETYQQTKPQNIKTVYEQGKFPIKDYRTIIDQQMKQRQIQKQQIQKQAQQRLNDIQNMQLKNQKSQIKVQEKKVAQNQNQISQQVQNLQLKKTLRSQSGSERFTKFSDDNKQLKQKQKQKQIEQDQLIRMKLGMTVEQYKIYKKKKLALNPKRDIEGENARKKIVQQKNAVVKVIQKFQKMDDLQLKKSEVSKFQSFNDNLSIDKGAQNKSMFNINQIKQQDMQDIDANVKIDQRKNKNNNITQDNQKKNNIAKNSPIKTKKPKQEDIQTVNSRVTSLVQKHFITSDQDEEVIQKKARKVKRKVVKKKKHHEQQIQQRQLQQDQKQYRGKKQIKQIPQKQINIPKKLVTTVKLREIPVTALSQFFTDHFQHLPKLIKKINIYKKQELIKYLLEHSSFSILQYIKQNVSIGLGVVLFNQNKSKYRSLNIVHLGSYDQNDYLDILVNIVRYCFKSDPCQQVAMSNIYDKDISQQWEFTKTFQKKFDPYGAIFQKKIFNTQFQRKYVLRRNIGQVCKVQIMPQFNRGMIKLIIDSFMVQADSQNQVNQLIQSEVYQQIGFNIGYYGLIAHFINQKYSQQTLAYIIAKSTSKDSTALQKTIASLAKLSLAMKKNSSYRRMAEITQQKFDNIMNLNLELLSKNQGVVSYPPQSIQRPLDCIWYSYKTNIQLCYDFYSQTIPIKISQNKQEQPDEYLCKYLRYTPNKKNKMFKIKSTAYSSTMTILPTKQIKYKIFILDPQQYDGILSKTTQPDQRLDLGVYLRVFFANLLQHQIPDYDHVWLPETVVKLNKYQISNLSEFDKAENIVNKIQKQSNTKQTFKRGILKSQLNLTYTDYLGNSLKIGPSHRDLVITPPFIIGILNMQIQTALEGSPIYVKRVDKSDLWWVKQIPKIVKESD